jgi:hypothetical protein
VAQPPSYGDTGLAVNLYDLDHHPEARDRYRFCDNADPTPVCVGGGAVCDTTAVVFTCGLLLAACICDIIREEDRRAGRRPTRAYVRRPLTWVEVPEDILLAVAVGTKFVLNPAVFGEPKAVVRRTVPDRDFF